MYIFLPLAVRAAYFKIIDIDQVFSDILIVSDTVEYVDYQHYKEIISAIRRYRVRASREVLRLFVFRSRTVS